MFMIMKSYHIMMSLTDDEIHYNLKLYNDCSARLTFLAVPVVQPRCIILTTELRELVVDSDAAIMISTEIQASSPLNH
jgi:hypothetical protein